MLISGEKGSQAKHLNKSKIISWYADRQNGSTRIKLLFDKTSTFKISSEINDAFIENK